MIFIFVGVDAAGKDTLIEEIHKRTDYNVLRGSSFELTHGKNENELFESFMEFTKMDNIILNRYMYCNYVYAPLFDDYAQIRLEDVRFIEKELKGDAMVIHLYADEDVIKQRFKSRGEDYVDKNKIKTIMDSYEKVLKHSQLDVLSFDTGELSVDEIVNEIFTYLK